jgi:hypothetical protein
MYCIPASATGNARSHETPFLRPLARASALMLALAAGWLPPAVVAEGGSSTPRLLTPSVAGSNRAEQATLHASDGGSSDFLGSSVALSGNTALLGAWQQTDEGSEGEGIGAAYVHTRKGGVWTERAKLIPSERPQETVFGWSVAIEDDVAVVGQICHPFAFSCTAPGAAYVFVRDGDVWREHAKLVAPDGAPEHNFGQSVAISGDIVLVGAPHAGPGAVYAFALDGWPSLPVKLVASDGAAGDSFGVSVALSGDTALVGAPGATVRGDAWRGAAYGFVRDGDGWSEEVKLVATDGAAGDSFGTSVALSGPMAPTGNSALVGAPWATVKGNARQGVAYAFTHDGAGLRQQEKLVATDGKSGAMFGTSVAAQGNVVVIGASRHPNEPEQANGAAYVYARAGGHWTGQIRLVPSEATFQLGASVALSNGTALLGAPTTTVDDMPGRGSAYVFRAQRRCSSFGTPRIAPPCRLGRDKDRKTQGRSHAGGENRRGL